MNKKRKRKPLPADISELVKKWRFVVTHNFWRIADWQPSSKPLDLPTTLGPSTVGRLILKHASALREVAADLERPVKKEARLSPLRKAVIIAWELLTGVDVPWDGSIPECQSPPTYKELTSKICQLLECEWTDKLERNVRFIADDLKLPMKPWGLQ